MEQFTEANRTLAIVKHVLVDPPEHQNGPYIEERAHLGGCRARRWQQAAPAAGDARTRWRSQVPAHVGGSLCGSPSRLCHMPPAARLHHTLQRSWPR